MRRHANPRHGKCSTPLAQNMFEYTVLMCVCVCVFNACVIIWPLDVGGRGREGWTVYPSLSLSLSLSISLFLFPLRSAYASGSQTYKYHFPKVMKVERQGGDGT